MTNFELARTFERVLIPYNGLYCLGGVRGALHCLEHVARHLTPDGELWLDAYAVDGFHAEAPEGDDGEEDPEPVAEVEVNGQTLWAFERTAWDREEQRLDVTYALKDADGTVIGRQRQNTVNDTFNVWVKRSFGDIGWPGFSIAGGVSYVGERRISAAQQGRYYPEAYLVDFLAAYTWGRGKMRYTVDVGVKNALDEEYVRSSSASKADTRRYQSSFRIRF